VSVDNFYADEHRASVTVTATVLPCKKRPDIPAGSAHVVKAYESA